MVPESTASGSSKLAGDGAAVRLCPMLAEDGPGILELFQALSQESIYNRFLAPIARLDEARLHALTHADPASGCVLAAWRMEGGRERMVGVGRFRMISADSAEIGIIVGDPWHRLGMGRMLLRQLTGVARERGLKWFESTIDPANLRLLRFVEACGFKGTLKYRDGLLHMQTEIAALFPADPRDPIEDHPRP